MCFIHAATFTSNKMIVISDCTGAISLIFGFCQKTLSCMTGTGCVIVYIILLLFVNSVHISSFFYSCRIRG